MLISKSLEDFSILLDFSVYFVDFSSRHQGIGYIKYFAIFAGDIVFIKGLWCFVEKQTNLILLQLSLLEP